MLPSSTFPLARQRVDGLTHLARVLRLAYCSEDMTMAASCLQAKVMVAFGLIALCVCLSDPCGRVFEFGWAAF
jgi:hypothetical protein